MFIEDSSVSGIIPSTLQSFSHFFFMIIMWDCHDYYPYFIDEENEAQRVDVMC